MQCKRWVNSCWCGRGAHSSFAFWNSLGLFSWISEVVVESAQVAPTHTKEQHATDEARRGVKSIISLLCSFGGSAQHGWSGISTAGGSCRGTGGPDRVATTTMENRMEIPRKTKHRTTTWPSNPTPGHPFREKDNLKTYMHSNIFFLLLFSHCTARGSGHP